MSQEFCHMKGYLRTLPGESLTAVTKIFIFHSTPANKSDKLFGY